MTSSEGKSTTTGTGNKRTVALVLGIGYLVTILGFGYSLVTDRSQLFGAFVGVALLLSASTLLAMKKYRL